MAGLEPEFQPVVNYLLPSILSHKQDPHDIHLQVNYIFLLPFMQFIYSIIILSFLMFHSLQLLQDMTSRLLVFLPQLEVNPKHFYFHDFVHNSYFFCSVFPYFCLGHSALYVKLQTDLSSFPDSPESNLRFLAMLAGPLYPILHVVNERLVCLLYFH